MPLSPGEWYKRVPRDHCQNLLFRRRLLKLCEKDRSGQAAIREACRTDLLFFVNVFVWQYNPRKKGKGEVQVGPFISWDFQDAGFMTMLECIELDEDLCIEKSREMGASWMLVLTFLWLFLFHPWQKFLLISRNEKAVEDEDPDSLFWKIDFVLLHLPDWLKPPIKKRKLYYGNEANGSTITGQASTGKAGVGGRATAMGIDEFSQIEEDYEVLHRTSDTTGCRIFNFTHRGLDTAAYEISQRVDMRKLRMHWTQHPDKRRGLYRYESKTNAVEVIDKTYHFSEAFKFVLSPSPAGGPFPGLRSPWYDKQCDRKGDSRAVAMDLDIDASGSVSQFFDPLMIRELQERYCFDPLWEGDIVFTESGLPERLERRKGGPLQLWINTVNENEVPVGKYVIGGDISHGTGASPSCLSIGNMDTGEKIGRYRTANVDATSFAVIGVALCRTFKGEDGQGAMFIWEAQGPGVVMGKRVLELGYFNIYYRNDDMKVFGVGKATIPGWMKTPDAADRLLSNYRYALKMRHCLNYSKEGLQECLSFKYAADGHVKHAHEDTTNDPAGARINHGDETIADALMWKLMAGKGPTAGKKKEDESPVGSLAWRRKIRENERDEAEAWA